MTYLSVKEAADIAKKNERTIRRWIKSGRLEYSEINGKYHVKKDSLYERLKIKERSKKEITKVSNFGQFNSSNNTGQNMIKNMSVDRHFTSRLIDKRIIVSPTKNDVYPDNSTFDTGQTKGIIREGLEYQLDNYSRYMSENNKNNMSVNNYHKDLILSDEANTQAVEMSKNIDSEMSVYSKYNTRLINSITKDAMVSVPDRHLSTISDANVDNFFDTNNIINNKFIDNKSLLSDNFSDNTSGHINRTIELSAYATRLLDEKDNIINRVDEQNKLLNNEIKALKTEINAIRVSMGEEKNNHANLDHFLLDSNKHWQEIITANLTMKSNESDNLVQEWRQFRSEWESKQDAITRLWEEKYNDLHGELMQNIPKKADMSGYNINFQTNKYFMFGLGVVLGGIALGLAIIMQFLLLNH